MNLSTLMSIGAIWHSCNVAASKSKAPKLPKSSYSGFNFRRRIALKGYDNCKTKGEAVFVSTYAIHQLHIFTLVLQVCHVLYCITTLALGRYKVHMRKWKYWENETKKSNTCLVMPLIHGKGSKFTAIIIVHLSHIDTSFLTEK